MKAISILLTGCLCTLSFCSPGPSTAPPAGEATLDTLAIAEPARPDTIRPDEIKLEKALLYDKHTPEDTYPYKDTTRLFQWDKVRERLALLENIQRPAASRWAILQNYKNRNGEAPLVKKYKRDAYKRIADTLGTERYQSVPLYLAADTAVPEIYGHDGALVRYVDSLPGSRMAEVETIYAPGRWRVPDKYLRVIADTVVFRKAIFVDRTNQNISTVEQTDSAWMIRSMNPATTGLHHPPYGQETPLGIFVIQEKKSRMIYLVDGSQATGGFAPYASRFTDGGYIHGVPVNAPRTALIEFSPSLGTTPRSHMCVRNATSHAKFIYDWAPVNETIVFVFD